MKKIGFLLCLVALSTFAQDEEFKGEIKWSELLAVNKTTTAPDIIGQDGSSIYLTRLVKGKRMIEKYRLANLTLEKSALLELSYNDKDLALGGQFMFDGKPTLLTSFFNKKTKKSYMFLQFIDPSNLSVSAPQKIGENYLGGNKSSMSFGMRSALSTSSGSSFEFFQVSENGKFCFALSADKDENTSDADLKSGNYGFKGVLIGKGGEIIGESKFKFSISNFVPIESRISNEGDVYFLGYKMVVNADAPKKVFGNAEKMKIGEVYMLILDVKTGEMAANEIKLEGKEVEMLSFNFSPDGGINVGGLTNTGGRGVSGSFLVKYDNNFNEVSVTAADFETDFITAGWSEKKKEDIEKKKDKGKDVAEPQLYNYYIDHVISKPDGSCLILAEQYYVVVKTTTTTTANGGTTTTTTYYYYYNDIIAVNYDKNGDFAWKKVIKKIQRSVNDGGYYSSYFVVQQGNAVNLIYNDSESNYIDTEGMSSLEIKALKRSTIGAKVNLTAEGEMSKAKLFEFEEGGLKLVPKVCASAGDKYVFLYARGKSGDKVGIIDLE